MVLASVGLVACAGGGEGPASTSAFDPTHAGAETSAETTSTGPDGSMTSMGPGPGDVTGEPPDGSCCQVAPTAGCGNVEIQTCVCTIEPMCCQRVWSQQCVDLAIMPCNDPACDEPPGTTGEPGDSSSDGGPPTLTCAQLSAQEGWMYSRCQNGDSQCNGMGTPTTDCDFCCGYCNDAGDVSCGDLATTNGWAQANCEWNGNGACGGSGTPTCDCNFCCEVN